MRVAIVTAYCTEPVSTLERCRNSVVEQVSISGCDIHQFMIADGHPQEMIDDWDVTHIRIPPQRDCGDTPRMIGALLAVSAGYDALAFLDADNWFEPNFVADMTRKLVETGCDIVTCPRALWRLDGTRMGIDTESDGISFNDTNCYLFRNTACFVLNSIAFKKDRHDALIGDQLLWKYIVRSGLDVRRAPRPLLNYESNNAWHYSQRSEIPPADSKYLVIDRGDGRPYLCFYRDLEFRADGTMFCPPEFLMAPDGSRPNARAVKA